MTLPAQCSNDTSKPKGLLWEYLDHFSGRRVARSVWSSTGTAPRAQQPTQYFTVTHPFHPWRGQRIELIDCHRQWGQWRVNFLSEQGHRLYLPASWTDLGPRDPFVEQSQGRAIARVEDLLELAQMTASHVKEITPNMST